MSDNILKKEFQTRDVQRMRNLITGKQGDRTTQGVGYNKEDSFHEEGDVWEEDGRTWTIKNGLKQNITKLDRAKKAHVTPLFCPNCKKIMKKRFDKDYYNIHKKCFDCVVEFETKLRVQGKFEEYQKQIYNSDIDGAINDFTNFMEEKLTESNNSFITEQGDVEKWVGGVDEEKAREAMDITVEELKKLKK